jgi:hypothetical protein
MNSIYSVFYDDKGKEIYIPKAKPIKESQAGEILNKLFESTAIKRQYNQVIRPVKKSNPRKLAEQTANMAKNKNAYKLKVEEFLKELEMYEKTEKENNIKVNKIIEKRNLDILFRK